MVLGIDAADESRDGRRVAPRAIARRRPPVAADSYRAAPLRLAAAPALDVARHAPGPLAAWRSRIENLASGLPGVTPARTGLERAAPLADGRMPLWYVIDPAEIQRSQEVRIHFTRRSPRRSGGPAPLTVARIGIEEIGRAPSREEALALTQLLTIAQAEAAIGNTQYGTGSYARDPSQIRAGAVVVPTALLDPVLPRLAATGRLALAPPGAKVWGDDATAEPQPLVLDAGAPWQLRLALDPDPAGGYALHGRFVRGEAEALALEAATLVLAGGFLVEGANLARAEMGASVSAVVELRMGALRIPEAEIDEALEWLGSLPGLPPLDLDASIAWSEGVGTPLLRLRFEDLDPLDREIEAIFEFGYGDTWVEAGAGLARLADRGSRRFLLRDAEAEARAFETLHALGFQARVHGTRVETSLLTIPRATFEAAAQELLAKGWILEVDGARLRTAGRSHARVTSGIDFFDLEGGIEFGSETVPFPALLAALRKDDGFVRLADGSRGLLPRTWLDRCAALAQLGVVQPTSLRFGTAQIGALDALLEAQDEARADRRFTNLRKKLAGFAGIEAIDAPPGFGGTLRGYQREGLGWLGFLEEFGLGGCLADDMGLGKTVQVLALLLARAQRGGRRGAARRTSLVVAPKSVIDGWVSEAARFAPALRVLRYEGPERGALRAQIDAHDLVVTTYGTMLRDIEPLAARRFDYAILDEAQAIKNAGSRTARAAKLLRADHRLALSGTPVENHLGELVSLLEFLNPGLLGSGRGLAALASGRQDAASIALLSRVVRPLLLRRTKEQVLTELPAKTEQTLLCDLEGRQLHDYEELRRHYQASIASRIETQGLSRSKIHVLEALLRLRQAACHPALIDPKRAAEPCAKLDLLFERLDEVIEEGHKALVFSQFTKFLALVRERLDARGIAYDYLDGRTRDRAERIARFESDPKCPLFLISLKAGGTGLNLTAADYVFLLDPWWNPAVEAQAIDRTHRIGQTRPVFAYRLVARGTVEERILELQERKRALVDSIFPSEASFLASLDAEDLRALLG